MPKIPFFRLISLFLLFIFSFHQIASAYPLVPVSSLPVSRTISEGLSHPESGGLKHLLPVLLAIMEMTAKRIRVRSGEVF